MKSLIVKSLAGTDEQYILIQARIKGSSIKIQGLGNSTNRPYGFTCEVSTDQLPELEKFILSQNI